MPRPVALSHERTIGPTQQHRTLFSRHALPLSPTFGFRGLGLLGSCPPTLQRRPRRGCRTDGGEDETVARQAMEDDGWAGLVTGAVLGW